MSDTVKDELVEFLVTPNTPVTRFLASLSDGRTVIQDDRPGSPHAWRRLAGWIKSNSHIKITEMRLQLGQRQPIAMPPNERGYCFGKKGVMVQGGSNSDFVGVGYYDGQNVNLVWYRVPDFGYSFTETRTRENAGFLLIENADG